MRKPSFGRQIKAADQPAMRNTNFEGILCDAIRGRRVVELAYKDDGAYRTFEPSAVYFATTDKVLVAGVQTSNPAKPFEGSRPHNFEVGLIRQLRVTKATFVPDPRFDRYDAKYSNGILCSV